MTCTITSNIEDAIERMTALDYEEHEYVDKFREWLARGDDVIVFSNHDLGSIGHRMLGMAMPIDRDADTPAHGPDGDWGLGWRYLPDLRLTADSTFAIAVPEEVPECLEASDECSGEVEYHSIDPGRQRAFPRCAHHWRERLRRREGSIELYADSDVAPSWFDPTAAGERWDED